MPITQVNDVMVGEPLVFEMDVAQGMNPSLPPQFWGPPAQADALPDIYIYRGVGLTTHVTTEKMVQDNPVTGRYYYELVPDAADSYHAVAMFTVDSNSRSWEWIANALADPGDTGGGSDGSGQIIAMEFYDRPEVDHVIYETAQGQLVAKQNPQ